MENINEKVGKNIRNCRKTAGLTLQELADRIHKSRASVCKYENGEITIDIQTLYEISKALSVPLNHLTYILVKHTNVTSVPVNPSGKSPFFYAKELNFYFYDGRQDRVKTGLIHIFERSETPGKYGASLSLTNVSNSGKSSEIFYSGKVVYSDVLIRFSFVNQYNSLEEDLLYIFNPLDIRDSTYGLLCGISSSDFMPCAFKCLVSLTPKEFTPGLKEGLLFTKEEVQKWKNMNMVIVDNMIS